jgi:triosephosphate isomerase
MARRPLVVGNWKMHGTAREATDLARALVDGARDEGVDLAVCPPFPYLAAVAGVVAGTRVALGAQNVSRHCPGAHTGEVAASMLRDVGCRFVIVGHSERRHGLGETDEAVRAKFERARDCGLVPIACVGETLQEREAGDAERVVGRQIDALLADGGTEALGESVIAYEPVWAIGTGRTATPEQAQDVHAFIRSLLGARWGELASGVRILYGGSVKAGNAERLFSMPDVDGGLIGGASLDADEFIRICALAG